MPGLWLLYSAGDPATRAPATFARRILLQIVLPPHLLVQDRRRTEGHDGARRDAGHAQRRAHRTAAAEVATPRTATTSRKRHGVCRFGALPNRWRLGLIWFAVKVRAGSLPGARASCPQAGRRPAVVRTCKTPALPGKALSLRRATFVPSGWAGTGRTMTVWPVLDRCRPPDAGSDDRYTDNVAARERCRMGRDGVSSRASALEVARPVR